MRGPGTILSTAVRAFRLGAREADLQLALKVGDEEALRLVGAELLDLVSRVEAGAPVAALYRGLVETAAVAGVDPGKPRPAEVTRALDELLGESPWFRLGSWTELARLAAMARNAEYFSSDGPAASAFSDVAARIRELNAVPPPLLSALDSLDGELRAGVTASRLDVVLRQVTQIITMAGGGSSPTGR
jgi:hypothetical protein